ncbi:MAG TPA: hypothetical protein PK504_08555 [Ferruginibacter sp.]|nr:hypothetical protein [Ferruginibacter sp.]HRE62595.1 hypothetical protein [Ferruginibacter sp.]
MQNEHIPAHLGKLVLLGLVDGALIMLVFWQYSKWLAAQSPYGIPVYVVSPILLIGLTYVLYRFLCLLIFNGTLGMKIFKVIYLDGEEQPLSIYDKLLASCFILYRGVDYYEKKETIV